MVIIWSLLIYVFADWSPNAFGVPFRKAGPSCKDLQKLVTVPFSYWVAGYRVGAGAGAGAVAGNYARFSMHWFLTFHLYRVPMGVSTPPASSSAKEVAEGLRSAGDYPSKKDDRQSLVATLDSADAALGVNKEHDEEPFLPKEHDVHAVGQPSVLLDVRAVEELATVRTSMAETRRHSESCKKCTAVGLHLGDSYSSQEKTQERRADLEVGELCSYQEESQHMKVDFKAYGDAGTGTASVGATEQESNANVSLREWISNSSRVIEKVENLHIFRQIAEFVELAHSQGVVLRNVRPSSFLLSSLSRVSIIDSASSHTSSSSSEESTGRAAVTGPLHDAQASEHNLQEWPFHEESSGVHGRVATPDWQVEIDSRGESMEVRVEGDTSNQVDISERRPKLEYQEPGLSHNTSSGDSLKQGHSLNQMDIAPGKMRLEYQEPGISGQNDLIDKQHGLTVSAEKHGSLLEKELGGKDSESWSDDESIQPCEEMFPLKRLLSMEQLWYKSPEELAGSTPDFCSDVYSLGVLFLELFHCPGSEAEWSRAMSDIRHRLLPPRLLLEYPKEAAFCLLLLHPNPSFRPKARDVLHGDIFSEIGDKLAEREAFMNLEEKVSEAEVTLEFLSQMQQEKLIITKKLSCELKSLNCDIEEVERWQAFLRRNKLQDSSLEMESAMVDILQKSHLQKGNFQVSSSSLDNNQECKHERLLAKTAQLKNNFSSLREIYFSTMVDGNKHGSSRNTNSGQTYHSTKQEFDKASESNAQQMKAGKLGDHLQGFFGRLCNFIRFTRFDVKASLQSGDFLNTGNMVCSVDFDCDGEFFATAGVCKKIKVFDCNALIEEALDIQYPVVEMMGRRKLRCLSWSNIHKNQLASSDLQGGVQLWDVVTQRRIVEYSEHAKCAWSVDFSHVDPVRLVSGSDDCCVKLWSMNQSGSVGTIRTMANVCCVQFSPVSSHLLAFGSADSNTYCYDLRYMKAPVCILTGHQKAVSFVRFTDSVNIISASTDNTLKLWDLTRASSSMRAKGHRIGPGNACITTFKGHRNEKNFVGLSVAEGGYIACGSETNEVFSYHKSLPMAMLTHKFGYVDPISGQEIEESGGQFVSSVCWRKKSQTLVAANSVGNIKILELA